MDGRTLALVLLLVGCGGSSSGETSPTRDAATDSATRDTTAAFDVTPSCPEFYPGPGNPCDGALGCKFKDSSCGGTIEASCREGLWVTVSAPECGPFCPPRMPTEGATCSGYPAGRVCAFWPTSKDVCATCTCTDGKWTCTSPATCAFDFATCTPGTACAANTGCGRGKCDNFCGCGVDAVLHCSANPC